MKSWHRIVTCKKPHECRDCQRPICAGERALKLAELMPLGVRGRSTVLTDYTCCRVR
jgi:hypothetical protein